MPRGSTTPGSELALRLGTAPPTDGGQTAGRPDQWGDVRELLGELYRIVHRLEALFPGRKFTPDGHLVRSISKVLAAHTFALDLLPGSFPNHDALAADGRKVQISFTQGTRSVALRVEPDRLIVLRLTSDRSIEVDSHGKGTCPRPIGQRTAKWSGADFSLTSPCHR